MAVAKRTIVENVEDLLNTAEHGEFYYDEKQMYEFIKQLNAIRAMCNERLYEMVFEEAYE